jgi:hypothetical protein
VTGKNYLKNAKLRANSHRRKLLDMAGEMLTGKQTSELLNLEQQAVEQRRISGDLIAVCVAADWMYPAFQFRAGDVLPRVAQIIEAHEKIDSWVMIDILLAPHETLSGRSLLDTIHEGDEQAVDRYVRQAQGNGLG